jgi:hypothetical protein
VETNEWILICRGELILDGRQVMLKKLSVNIK